MSSDGDAETAIETLESAAGGVNAASQLEAKQQKDAYEKKKKKDLILKHISKAKLTAKLYPNNLCVKHLLALSKKGILEKMRLPLLERLFACAKSGMDNAECGYRLYPIPFY